MDVSAAQILTDNSTQIGAAGGVGMTSLFWWIVKKAHRRIDDVEKEVDSVEKDILKGQLDLANHRTEDMNRFSEASLDLAKHKEYSEGNYVKADALNRLHTRIDDVVKGQAQIYNVLIEKLGK